MTNLTIKYDIDTEILGGGEYIPQVSIYLSGETVTVRATDVHQAYANGTPSRVWDRLDHEWLIRMSQGAYAQADESLIREFVEKITPLLERVAAGHSDDGLRGRLDEDAVDAGLEIDHLIYEGVDWSKEVWDASDWVAPSMDELCRDLGLSADSTDEEKSAAAEALCEMAAADYVIIADASAAIDMLVERLEEQQANEEE